MIEGFFFINEKEIIHSFAVLNVISNVDENYFKRYNGIGTLWTKPIGIEYRNYTYIYCENLKLVHGKHVNFINIQLNNFLFGDYNIKKIYEEYKLHIENCNDTDNSSK